MADVLNPFVVEMMGMPGGDKVLQCYQCGTCSGSCPVIEEMEYGPRRIMHLIQLGEKEKVLSSKDMWFCVSCYSCANRCPRDIQITDVMASLRELSEHQGYATDREAEFGQAFANTLKHHGRLFEPELMIRYYLRTMDIPGLISMIPLGMQMLLKNKLSFLPERIKTPEVMHAMCPEPQEHAAAPVSRPAAQKKGWLPWLVGGLLMVLGAGLSGILWGLTSRRGKLL
ncbi:MAG: 4Fe-4S dicluster domain-containing protein [Anaerolineae bacterium]|nr:4Fe-4S dicluster domain-containing protein [Anaerolineae bacterium]